MKKRLFIAVSIGAIFFLRAAEELYFRTKIPIHGVAFWSLAAYFEGITITYAVTDVFCIKIARKLKRQKIITTREREWKHGRKPASAHRYYKGA